MPTLYSTDKLHIGAEWRDGELVISGHDLAPPGSMGDEYEYWITVPTDQLAALAELLATTEDRDAIMTALVARGEEICREGERTWLEDAGIRIQFFSYF